MLGNPAHLVVGDLLVSGGHRAPSFHEGNPDQIQSVVTTQRRRHALADRRILLHQHDANNTIGYNRKHAASTRTGDRISTGLIHHLWGLRATHVNVREILPEEAQFAGQSLCFDDKGSGDSFSLVSIFASTRSASATARSYSSNGSCGMAEYPQPDSKCVGEDGHAGFSPTAPHQNTSLKAKLLNGSNVPAYEKMISLCL